MLNNYDSDKRAGPSLSASVARLNAERERSSAPSNLDVWAHTLAKRYRSRSAKPNWFDKVINQQRRNLIEKV